METFVTDDTPLGRMMVAKELCLFLFLGLSSCQTIASSSCDLDYFDKQCYSFMLSGPTIQKKKFPMVKNLLVVEYV